jgi:hypothetical protein
MNSVSDPHWSDPVTDLSDPAIFLSADPDTDPDSSFATTLKAKFFHFFFHFPQI